MPTHDETFDSYDVTLLLFTIFFYFDFYDCFTLFLIKKVYGYKIFQHVRIRFVVKSKAYEKVNFDYISISKQNYRVDKNHSLFISKGKFLIHARGL